jgi:hypothetical protein
VALLLLLCVAPLGRTLQTLHAERKGFRKVGCWMAEHVSPEHELIDPYCWVSYYAGRVFREEDPAKPDAGSPGLRYVVLEDSTSRHEKLIGLPAARALAGRGHLVHTWYVKRGKGQARIELFEVGVE